MEYEPPGGAVGPTRGQAVRPDARAQQIENDLRRFKQVWRWARSIRSRREHPPAGRTAARPGTARSMKETSHESELLDGKEEGAGRGRARPQILNARDAIVRMTSTAICGSDLHLYNGFVPTMEKGDVLGHEFMGEVVEVGPGVKKLKVGDRVVVPFPIACGVCGTCREELYLAVRELQPQRLDGREAVGPFARGHLRLLAHARRLRRRSGGVRARARSPTWGRSRCPSELTDEQVLFLSDIFPTGYMGAEMCDIKPGDVVAVWGAGPVGPVRHRQRAAAGRRAGHRHRPLPLPAADGRARRPAPPTSSTTRRWTSTRR